MGKVWLHRHRAGIKFNPTVLVVNGIRAILGSLLDRSMTVVAEDIKLPPRTAVSGRGRLVTEEEMKKEDLQLVPIEGVDPEENEVALCEMVVEAAEIVTIMLVRQASKTGRMKKGEAVGKAS